MTTKHWMLTVFLALAAQAGIAQGNTDKTIDVTVDGSANISADPDPVTVRKSINKLRWELKTAGYTFADNGIVIKDASGDYGDCGIKGSKKTVFECKKLRHIDRQSFKYDINLLNSANQPVYVDPVIQNE
jgi:hypothetical protein